jgi:hypothetical protein
MSQNLRSGREARGTPRPPYVNSPALAHVLLRTERTPPELPPGARCQGRVRIPLTLHLQPWARLYALHDGELAWWVRLPDAEGAPRWRRLPRDEPLRFALASGLPELAGEVRRLIAHAERERTTVRLSAPPAPTEVA